MKTLLFVVLVAATAFVASCDYPVFYTKCDSAGKTPDGGSLIGKPGAENVANGCTALGRVNGLPPPGLDGGVVDAGNPDGGSNPDAGTSPDGGVCMGGNPVDLGYAGNFVILAESGVSTVPQSTITGNVGVSPAAATYLTGFSQTNDSSNTFSTSAQVTGQLYASDYSPPTPSEMTTAVSDMQTAFTDAAGRAPSATELGAGDISGMTLPAGVYKWSTGLGINTDLTLAGSECDVWIFEVAQDMTVADGVIVHLTGGALAKNVFWQVSGHTTLGTTVQFNGVILDQTMINLRTGASIVGRLYAQTAVTLDMNVVTQPE